MFIKQVQCRNCGFLAWYEAKLTPDASGVDMNDFKYLRELEIFGFSECRHRLREQIANVTLSDVGTLTCARRVWSYYELTKEQVKDFLNVKRKCPYFSQYIPSYSPHEHRELQREAKTQSLLIKGTILAAVIGALIGAAAAIVAQLITK